MATQPMTKFVSANALYLKAPTDDQIDTILAWMGDRKLEIESIREGEAIFTQSGKGKPSPAVEIIFTSPTDPTAEGKLNELYPAPKDLAGIKITDVDVTDPVSDMPLAPIQEPAPGSVSIAEVMGDD